MKKSIFVILLTAFAVLLVSCASTRAYVEGAEEFELYPMYVAKKTVSFQEYTVDFDKVKDRSIGISLGDLSLGNRDVKQNGTFFKNYQSVYDISLSSDGAAIEFGYAFDFGGITKSIIISKNGEEIPMNFLSIEPVYTTLNKKGRVYKTGTPLGYKVMYKGQFYCVLDFNFYDIALNPYFPIKLEPEEKDTLYAYLLSFYYYTQFFETGRNRSILDGGFGINIDL